MEKGDQKVTLVKTGFIEMEMEPLAFLRGMTD